MTKIASLRKSECRRQNGRCYYCDQPIWEEKPERFAKRHALTRKQAMLFRSTAEHLIAQSESGRDIAENIVAACHFCNVHRHRTPRPLLRHQFLQHVRKRLAKGKWHRFRTGKPT